MKILNYKCSLSKVKLKDVASINMGQSPASSSYVDKKDGFPFFQGVSDFGDRYPTERIYTNQPKKWANKNDILFSVRAPVGKLNIANKDLVIGRGICSLKINKNNNLNYIYYLLLNNEYKWSAISTGSIFQAVNKNDIENFDLYIHSNLKEQENISNLLLKQETQIKNIKQLIKKIENRNQYYAEKILSGELRVRKDENGNIEFYNNTEWQDVILNGNSIKTPLLWKVKKITEIIKTKKGSSIKSDLLNYIGNGIQYLRTNEVWDDSSVNKDKIYFDGETTSFTVKDKSEYIICFDGFNTKPHIGTVGMVTNNGEGICSGELHKIQEIDGISKYYVNVMILKNSRFQDLICRSAEGSTVKHAGKHFKYIEEILIPMNEQELLNDVFKKQLYEIDSLKSLLNKEQLRFQWLLDNLLSGEYQVVDE